MTERKRVCWFWALPVLGAALAGLVVLRAVGKRSAPEQGATRHPSVEVTLASGSRAITGFPSRFAERQTASERGTAPYVVALSNGASKVEAMMAVRTCGARVIGPLPPNAFLVETSVFALGRLSQDPHFAAATEFLPSDKIAPGFTGGWATVVALTESDVQRLSEFAREKGGELEPKGPRGKTSLVVRLTPALLAEFAQRGEVRWIEPRPDLKLLNDYAAVDTGVVATRTKLGLTGAGQVIASADSGLDTGDLATLHHDFTNRVLRLVNLGGYTTVDKNGHGTHTAGTLAGSGVMSDGLYRGVAPEAKLFIQCCGDKRGSSNIYFDNAETFDDIFAAGIPSGAYIHSDSWGGVYEDDAGKKHYGYYDDFCEGLDDVMWRHPELLVVVANGNDGAGRMTVGTPASAKNCLAVGSTFSSRKGSDPLSVSSYSSRGPCADGRIKPEIAAPGKNIVSTRSTLSGGASFGGNPAYAQMSGTSMATPHVAGCAALVRQWLVERQGFTNALPTAALLKAVLTGGARSASLLPDNDRGWGLVDLDETLAPSNRAVRLVDRVPYGDGTCATYGFTLTNAAPFEVQLAWLDYPATLGASSALVNDLDLVVSNRATGATWRGNGVEGGDRTNTVESVRVAEMPAGEYDIIVVGRDVLYPSTLGGAAALYVRGAFEAEDEAWSEDEPEPVRTLSVDASRGDDETADGSDEAPFASISNALAVAKNGDTVRVAPGTYEGFAVPEGLVVEIVSAQGPSLTFLDGRGVARCYEGSDNFSTVLRGFTLVNGLAEYGGGACGGSLVGCVISNCTATAGGGGAYQSVLENCLVVSNRAETSEPDADVCGGGAMDCDLYGCTLVGNLARSESGCGDGGGAYVGDEGNGCAYNTVFFGNTVSGAGECWGPDYYDGSGYTAKCLIGEDPLFADDARGDYRLRADSPCVDAGCDEMVSEASDLAGVVRIQGSAVDVGCYEYEQKVAFDRRTLWCSAAAQERTAGVFADGRWSLSSDAEWVVADGTSGTGGTTATLRIAKNETGAARTAKVTLREVEGDARAVLEIRQVAVPAQKGGTRYGLFVGVNEYDRKYVDSYNWLSGCVPDALSLQARCVASRLLRAENATILTNALATKTAIRAKLADLAAKARAGDVVVYTHSSHGWKDPDSPKDAGLCTYDDDYDDVELADDLSGFADGVRVIVIVDTCHSGGLFKAPGSLRSLSASVARGALRILKARRLLRRGLLAANPGAADYAEDGNVAFIAAADYDQYSWDEGVGGAFTGALVQGWASGASEADGDGRIDFRELYDYAAVRAVGERADWPENWTDAQCFNEPLLLTTLAELIDAQWSVGLAFSANEAFGIRLNAGTKAPAVHLEWSTDQVNWATFGVNADYKAAADADTYRLYLRGTDNRAFAGGDADVDFEKDSNVLALSADSVATAIACSGNIETLLDYVTVATGGHPAMDAYAFSHLFCGFAALTAAPALPATTLSESCYSGMFESCTSLTDVPELPATQLERRCYGNMFRHCSNIVVNACGPGRRWQVPATAVAQEWGVDMFTFTGGAVTGQPEPNATYYAGAKREPVGDATLWRYGDEVGVSVAGELTKELADSFRDRGVTNLWIGAGVTGIGANAFEGWTALKSVTLGEDCTRVGERSFEKCFCLTNVTSVASGVVTLADYAFVSCNSLESLSFAGTPTFGTQSFTLMTGIYMKGGGIPEVYTIPEIACAGIAKHVLGKKSLGDTEWDDLTALGLDPATATDYHFFKVEMR